MAPYPCRICGASHDLPEALAAGLPEPCLEVPEGERDERVVVGEETCKLDDRRFFLRGNIDIPVPGRDAPLVWTVWAELSRKPFKRALALWMRDVRQREPPYPGALATSLPFYEPATLGLPVSVTTQAVGIRFAIAVEADHPLARDQARGAPFERLRPLAEAFTHG